MKLLLTIATFFSVSVFASSDLANSPKAMDEIFGENPSAVVASISCDFEDYQLPGQGSIVVNAELRSTTTSGYQLVTDSPSFVFPGIAYDANSLKVGPKVFIFKGAPKSADQLPIYMAVLEKNNPGKLCGAFQLLDSGGITVGGTVACCKYIKKPIEEINFENAK